MANTDNKKQALSNKPSYRTTISFEVGYKKPPKHTQFKKGQSGNYKGRPKGAKNKTTNLKLSLLSDLILEEAYRDITIREGDKSLTVPIIRATLRSLAINAAKGKQESQKLFLDPPIPDPIPHPKHNKIDPYSGNVTFIGPMCEDEKSDWDTWVARKLNWQRTKLTLEIELDKNNISDEKTFIIEDLRRLDSYLNAVREFIPDNIYIPHSTLEFIKSNPECHLFKT